MLQIENDTALETGLALFNDQLGRNIVSIATKATFQIPIENNYWTLAAQQLPVLSVPEYSGEASISSIKYPQDLVLEKLATDIVFVGSAHAPKGKPITQLEAELQLGSNEKKVRVIGDRRWIRGALGNLEISEPDTFVAMPISYEGAFGGYDQATVDTDTPSFDPRNPVGVGYTHRSGNKSGFRLPNIEDARESIRSPRQHPPIAGFGALDAHWTPRKEFAGTYDEAWRVERYPLPPADLDARFFSCAAEGLVTEGFLKGGESVWLKNLWSGGNLEFDLPCLLVHYAFILAGREVSLGAQIWTVVLEPDLQRVHIVWGANIDVGKQPSQLSRVRVEVDPLSDLSVTTKGAQ